jgi:hypothetical protein
VSERSLDGFGGSGGGPNFGRSQVGAGDGSVKTGGTKLKSARSEERVEALVLSIGRIAIAAGLIHADTQARRSAGLPSVTGTALKKPRAVVQIWGQTGVESRSSLLDGRLCFKIPMAGFGIAKESAARGVELSVATGRIGVFEETQSVSLNTAIEGQTG